MGLTRREFLELMGRGTVTVGVAGVTACASKTGGSEWVAPVKKSLEEKAVKAGNLPVLWIQGQSCAGCSISTINTVYPEIAEVLTETISLEFHPNIMASAGDLALKILTDAETNKKGKYVLVVEGSIPTKENGIYSTMGESNGKHITAKEWVERLGANAQAVLSVGTCAAFGGIPSGTPNPTGAMPVYKIIPKATVINIPGCPCHPDWVVGTIAHVLLFGVPELDEEKRPKLFFGKLVHDQCERRGYFDEGKMAKDYGDDEGCLFELGCKGPISHCDVPIRSWNNKVNWCIQCGSPCIGCTEPTFPDHEGEGLYSVLPVSKVKDIRWTGKIKKVKNLV
ncbi:iron hydrogenase [candidate division KSB1 bacterium]|nr:MAG: iron hydrogenase [candidate division KSB1 bacterium]